jgi:hypothetical protein
MNAKMLYLVCVMLISILLMMSVSIGLEGSESDWINDEQSNDYILIDNDSYDGEGSVFAFFVVVIVSFMIFLTIFSVIIFLIVFWILMIVDCAKRDFKKDDERVVWILILVFLGWIGAIIYYFSVKIKDKK